MIDNSKKWDGNGLPPVGCECLTQKEALSKEWTECKILAHTEFGGLPCAVFQTKNTISCSSEGLFRPIKSEADKKREKAIDLISEICRSSASNSHSAELIYDAISSGKITGIKLED